MKIRDRDSIGTLIDHFADQALAAYNEPLQFSALPVQKDANYIVCGMGGSSFVIDVLRDMLLDGLHIYTSRTYSLPREANEKSLVCISSYSGNTEEALSCYKEALKRKMRVFATGAGGKLEALAKRDGVPFLKISAPGVTQPRYSSGFQLGYQLRVLEAHGLIQSHKKVLEETAREALKFRFQKQGLALAKKLFKRIPVLYVDVAYYSVARVGTIKIMENSKTLAHWNVLPEMNHNEMNGFYFSKRQGKFSAVFLETTDSHPRILKRMKIVQRLAKEKGLNVHRVVLPGRTHFSRMIAGIEFMDWTSYYLAQLNGIDPSPVDMVEDFKKMLG